MREIPLTGTRAMIARKMSASLLETAQLSYHTESRVDILMLARQRYKEAGHTISVEDLIIYALGKALQQHPMLNGTIHDDGARLSDDIHINVAISGKRDLIAPTLRHVEKMSIVEISKARQHLMAMVNENSLKPSDMQGGTFTVSNLGTSCVDYFTPIINPPQLAIMGIGRIKNQLRYAKDESVIGVPTVSLSLTADHRFIDGYPVSQFLDSLSEILNSESTWENYF